MNRNKKTLAIAVVMVCHTAYAAATGDYVYRIVKGDTLIGLSSHLLNAPEDWPKVARHNRLPNPNHIVPGNELRVPLALLKSSLAHATVTHTVGDVKVSAANGAPSAVAALGATLGEGATVVTGKDGFATLRLQDGSTVRVQSASQVQVERMRTYPDVGLLESAMKLISGRVTSLVQKFRAEDKKETRHGVTTPTANLAVRGTEFRVSADEQGVSRGEVLEGAVAIAAAGATGSAGSAQGKRLDAGFGSVVDANRNVSDPIALLAAPNLLQLAPLQERTILRFPLPAIPGAHGYRAQVARDAGFNTVVAEIVSATADLRLTNIDDGSYFMRVRAFDARGLEGRDATHAFKLKARPEPPLVTSPAAKGKVRATEVEFKWAENTAAATYHLQVARDPSFKTVVHENKAVAGGSVSVAKLPVGEYFWRVASLRKDGDRGPYGDVSAFTLLPPPAQPEPPLMDATGIQFRWSGEPGQTFEFEVANEAKFVKPIITQKVTTPELTLPLPNHGTYYMRFRAIDADGFVGPYTSAQRFVVPELPFPYTHPVAPMPLFTP